MQQDNQLPQLQLNPSQQAVVKAYLTDAIAHIASTTFAGEIPKMISAVFHIIYQQGRKDMAQALLTHDSSLEQQAADNQPDPPGTKLI